MNRSLPDVRKPSCRQKVYPDASLLPSTSIIIVYHNEAFSTLMRTVTSVILRSPKRLLKEIILVDDFSTREFLKKELENELMKSEVSIKLIRAKDRVGLIRARLMGAAEASGDVLTFLDSHCECTEGWLEPLLARIKEDKYRFFKLLIMFFTEKQLFAQSLMLSMTRLLHIKKELKCFEEVSTGI